MTGGWSNIERRRAAADKTRRLAADSATPTAAGAPEQPTDPDGFVALCRDVLGTRKGRKLLSHLRKMTKDSIVHPGVEASALWFREGQRQLVGRLERALADGLKVDADKLRDELSKDG